MRARRMLWMFFAVVLGVVLVSYVFESKKPQPAVARAPETVVQPITPIADGNGFYYFPVVGEQYRRALSQFYTDHPDMDCAYHGAAEGLNNGSFVSGHILHCRDVATSAQDITIP